LRRRFAGPQPPQPSERWVDGSAVYFAFDLIPLHNDALFTALVLFVVHAMNHQLLLVRVITPTADATEAQMADIYRLEGAVAHEQP
jgi:hypothetical protein